MKQRKGDQPLPVRNDAPDIQSQVIADIEARRLVGIERYGTALQPWNGRDALRDLYEELLDAAMYVKQAMVERGNRRSEAEIRALALREASVVARGRGHEEFAQYLAVRCIDCGGHVKHSEVRDDFVCRGCGRVYSFDQVALLVRANYEGDR